MLSVRAIFMSICLILSNGLIMFIHVYGLYSVMTQMAALEHQVTCRRRLLPGQTPGKYLANYSPGSIQSKGIGLITKDLYLLLLCYQNLPTLVVYVLHVHTCTVRITFSVPSIISGFSNLHFVPSEYI